MNLELDEQDLALLHALQIAPRISWTEAGRVLGSTPTTLATRWERLRAAGMAWVTVHPIQQIPNVTVAFVEIDVAQTQKAEVIDKLCRDSRAVTIDEVTSGRTLILIVEVSDYDSMCRFVLDDLPGMGGVQRINAHLVTEIHWEGSRWRLDALDQDQQGELHANARQRGAAELSGILEDYWPLVEALAYDGRRSIAELARITGRNPATARRQVPRLVSSGLLLFRCEVAQLRTRWPIMCMWFARVPLSDLERTVRALTTLPELRLCVSTTGETNLRFVVWVQSPSELKSMERMLGEKMPWLTLVESVISLRSPKRMGWILDTEGRSTGDVVAPVPHTGGTSRAQR